MTRDEMTILEGKSSQWNIGDIVKLSFFDKVMDFRVVHRNYFTDGKVVLMPTEILYFAPFDRKTNDYIDSYLRNFVNTAVFSGFLPEIRKAMTDCNIKCLDRHNTIFIKDKIFVPSVIELGLSEINNPLIPMEGQKFDYFKQNEDRELRFGKEYASYLTRTPITSSCEYVWGIYMNGDIHSFYATVPVGLTFAFEI